MQDSFSHEPILAGVCAHMERLFAVTHTEPRSPMNFTEWDRIENLWLGIP